MTRLSEYPDWAYLLQEYSSAYRFGSAGGSAGIRSHMRQVRTRLSRVLQTDPEINRRQPQVKPVVQHLGRALDNGTNGLMAPFIRAFAKVTGELTWEYGYEKMPKGLESKFAYADILGPDRTIPAPDLTLGVVLFAPRCTYPAHSHKDIVESYICLSGSFSENDMGVFGPGSLLVNQPGHEHRITTSDREPVLLGYAWLGEGTALSNPLMKFTRTRK
jgi:dimethylpropiothetin dethiomethylase